MFAPTVVSPRPTAPRPTATQASRQGGGVHLAVDGARQRDRMAEKIEVAIGMEGDKVRRATRARSAGLQVF